MVSTEPAAGHQATPSGKLGKAGALEEGRQEAELFMASYPMFKISHWAATEPFGDETILGNLSSPSLPLPRPLARMERNPTSGLFLLLRQIVNDDFAIPPQNRIRLSAMMVHADST